LKKVIKKEILIALRYSLKKKLIEKVKKTLQIKKIIKKKNKPKGSGAYLLYETIMIKQKNLNYVITSPN